MKTIIVPTDFSELSLNAVKYAADMARILHINLSILHVAAIPKSFLESSPPIYSVAEVVEDADRKLNHLRDKLLTETEYMIRISVMTLIGEFISVLDEYCAMLETYAIVIGADSTDSFEKILFGDKSLSSVSRLSYPLIVVPNNAHFTGLKKIGLACDFKEVFDTIPVKEIKSLLMAHSTELYVLHVSHDNKDALSEEVVLLRKIIGDFKPKYCFIDGTDVEKGIIDFADKNNLDLLIVIPKKHSLINKLFHHSHSKQLVLQSHVPVMAIHEQD